MYGFEITGDARMQPGCCTSRNEVVWTYVMFEARADIERLRVEDIYLRRILPLIVLPSLARNLSLGGHSRH